MLSWAIAFFIIAIVAAVFGFGGIAAGAAGIAKVLFFLFLIAFVVSLIVGWVGGRGRRVWRFRHHAAVIQWIAAAAALFAALFSAGAFACSCADISRAAPARLADFVARAERVVHARVVGLQSPQEARIEVIESFKGSGERLEAQRGSDATCGFTFEPGEERVYFVFSGAVNLCGRAAPSAELLERLRHLKVAQVGCEGIVHPMRPPAAFAVEEAKPLPYKTLYGYDPDLALGVGHVRPMRVEERDASPRRLKLPVFTAPGGEVKIWLSPG